MKQPPIDLDAEHQKDMMAWLHSKKQTHLQYDELSRLFLEEIKTGTPEALVIVEELESLLDRLKSDENTTKPYIEAVIALTDEAYQMELELFARHDAQYDAQQAAEKAAAAEAKVEARREKRERQREAKGGCKAQEGRENQAREKQGQQEKSEGGLKWGSPSCRRVIAAVL